MMILKKDDDPPGIFSRHFFAADWNRQTRVRSLVFTQNCNSSLRQRRTNSKYISNNEPPDAVCGCSCEKYVVGSLTVGFLNTHFPFTVFFLCLRLSGGDSQYQADNNQEEFRSSEKSLTTRQRSKDKTSYSSSFESHGSDRIQAIVECNKNV